MTSDRTINILIIVAVLLLLAAGGLAASLIGAHDEPAPVTSGR
jgi:flagellar basal body-associated protein FliL